MKKIQYRVSATALVLVVCLSVASPAFARRDTRGPRDLRERVVRFLTKIQTIIGITANNDGMTPPKP